MAKKKNRNVPVHSMADEPPVRYEDIAVELPVDRDGVLAALEAEIEAEYDLIDSPEVGPDLKLMAPPRRTLTQALAETDDPAELTGPAQDDRVDAMEELKEIAEIVAARQPAECPTCHRPFLAATVGKDGTETKSSRIRRMAAEGLEKGVIAKTLGISYQFVHNVLSRPIRTA